MTAARKTAKNPQRQTREVILDFFSQSPGAENVTATLAVSDKGQVSITFAWGTLVLNEDGTHTTVARIKHF